MFESLGAFTDWLAETPISLVIQNHGWIIPTVQSVHILAIAMVMGGAIAVSLRVLGWLMRDLSVADVARRFMPWIWYSLIVLLVSGAILVIGEPGRSLNNQIFQLKMLLLIVAITAMLALVRPLRSNSSYWDGVSGTRGVARGIAVFSLAVWSCIIFAGRWIAYAG